ncbi:MAG: DUF5009 domain-containing protein [Bacteroidota bacterium]
MNTEIKPATQERMLSIDFFRGFTMFLLISGIGGLFNPASTNKIISLIGIQLDHAEWSGLNFWDLIQPFFMFIVGVSMPFSFSKRWERGDSWNKTFLSALRRSLLLLLLGWAISSTDTYSTFTNVLAQLSFTYLVAFLIMRKDVKWQLVISFALIIFTDIIYRYWNVEGFNQPFTADHNFGSWVDVVLTGHVSEDRWVAFNAIPTAAHTIWGVLAGKVLMSEWTQKRKISALLIGGLIGVVIGYGLSAFIPIIKRTCTSSFIFVSGGWALMALAFSYWLIDGLKYKKLAFFFAVVGMNPLFIYLFTHSGGREMLGAFAKPFIYRLFSWSSPQTIQAIMILVVTAMLWLICYFLYKKKLFIRI